MGSTYLTSKVKSYRVRWDPKLKKALYNYKKKKADMKEGNFASDDTVVREESKQVKILRRTRF